MSVARPFDIPKELVAAAFRAVKSNAGGAEIDKETIGQFESKLGDDLYKSEIACRQGPTSRRQSRRLPVRRRVAGKKYLACPRFQTGWLRWWSRWCLSLFWSLSFFRIPTATGRRNPRWMRWRSRASVAGRVRSSSASPRWDSAAGLRAQQCSRLRRFRFPFLYPDCRCWAAIEGPRPPVNDFAVAHN